MLGWMKPKLESRLQGEISKRRYLTPSGNQGGFQGEVTAELKLKERAEVSHREETGRRVSFILGLLILGIS